MYFQFCFVEIVEEQTDSNWFSIKKDLIFCLFLTVIFVMLKKKHRNGRSVRLVFEYLKRILEIKKESSGKNNNIILEHLVIDLKALDTLEESMKFK